MGEQIKIVLFLLFLNIEKFEIYIKKHPMFKIAFAEVTLLNNEIHNIINNKKFKHFSINDRFITENWNKNKK